jgi:uncharacterized membrane protein YedE/YeeE
MAKNLSAFVAGLLFGLGLTIAQMINPQKVLGFLDITGQWDGSLALVMASALTTVITLQHFIFRRAKPLYEAEFNLPTSKAIDARLLSGAALFGMGWGLAGLCPGPAIAGLGFGIAENILFVLAMLAGMGLFQFLHGEK